MRTRLLILIMGAILLPIALAAECDYGDYLSRADGMDIRDLSPADAIVGTDTSLQIVVDNLTRFVIIEDGLIAFGNATSNATEYTVTTDSCTLSAIRNKTVSGIDAYNDGRIHVAGRTLSAKTRVFFGSVAAKVYGWFG